MLRIQSSICITSIFKEVIRQSRSCYYCFRELFIGTSYCSSGKCNELPTNLAHSKKQIFSQISYTYPKGNFSWSKKKFLTLSPKHLLYLYEKTNFLKKTNLLYYWEKTISQRHTFLYFSKKSYNASFQMFFEYSSVIVYVSKLLFLNVPTKNISETLFVNRFYFSIFFHNFSYSQLVFICHLLGDLYFFREHSIAFCFSLLQRDLDTFQNHLLKPFFVILIIFN